ncbi:HGxxPAAW family protein [Streptomyces sp. NPDC086787]|uniref:HGxxPAAW family protein n=1 Tax=Streptomyces sp. NPDC086787 TaxID=3365759 RepID=UPI0037FA394D
MSGHLHDEGHTVAGWTGTAVATIGSTVVGVGMVMTSTPLMAVGLAVVAVSVLVTWSLHLAGWGKPPGPRPKGQWGMRLRDTGARAGHPGCVSCRLAGRGRRASTAVQETATVHETAEAEAGG